MSDTAIELTAGSSDRNAAVLAGFLGWTLDAFDWFIVTLCQVHIAASLNVDPGLIVLCLTLTLAARPVGAFIFGLLADRYGRRRPMMINLVFYSSLSVLSGLAHTYHTFLLCRILFGIGMGGEWGRGRVAGNGESSPKAARFAFGIAPGRIRRRGTARDHRIFPGSSKNAYRRVAAPVLDRRIAGAAGILHPLSCERIRRLGENKERQLGQPR